MTLLICLLIPRVLALALVTRMRKLERVPHQFKEPAEAGMVDKMPSKITQMMILSVAHVAGIGRGKIAYLHSAVVEFYFSTFFWGGRAWKHVRYFEHQRSSALPGRALPSCNVHPETEQCHFQ